VGAVPARAGRDRNGVRAGARVGSREADSRRAAARGRPRGGRGGGAARYRDRGDGEARDPRGGRARGGRRGIKAPQTPSRPRPPSSLANLAPGSVAGARGRGGVRCLRRAGSDVGRGHLRRLCEARRHRDVARDHGPGAGARAKRGRPAAVLVRGDAGDQLRQRVSDRRLPAARRRLRGHRPGSGVGVSALHGAARRAAGAGPVHTRGAPRLLAPAAGRGRVRRCAAGAAGRLLAVGRGEGGRRGGAAAAGRVAGGRGGGPAGDPGRSRRSASRPPRWSPC
jgi:hypothetical protein